MVLEQCTHCHNYMGRIAGFLCSCFKASLNPCVVSYLSTQRPRSAVSPWNYNNNNPFSMDSGDFSALPCKRRALWAGFVLTAVCVAADAGTRSVRSGSWSPGARAARAAFHGHVAASAVAARPPARPRRSRGPGPAPRQPRRGQPARPRGPRSACAAAPARPAPAAGSAAPSALLGSAAGARDVSRGRAVSSKYLTTLSLLTYSFVK